MPDPLYKPTPPCIDSAPQAAAVVHRARILRRPRRDLTFKPYLDNSPAISLLVAITNPRAHVTRLSPSSESREIGHVAENRPWIHRIS
eukprot:s30_g37.t1